MSSAKVGFLYSLFCSLSGVHFLGPRFFIYLTNWTLLLHMFALLSLCLQKKKSELQRNLLIVSWTMGWVITIMFWVYIFPIIDLNLLPPVWHYVSTHGGVHLFIVYEFLNSNLHLEKKDFKWPILMMLSYLFLMVLPLKSYGIIIYPLFFDEVIATISILLGSFLVLGIAFYTGIYSLSKKKKNF